MAGEQLSSIPEIVVIGDPNVESGEVGEYIQWAEEGLSHEQQPDLSQEPDLLRPLHN